MEGSQNQAPELRVKMNGLSAEIDKLKKLSEKTDPTLYTTLQAAWLGLCLLNDDRLSSLLNKSENAAEFKRDKADGLLRAVQSLEQACAMDRDVVTITEKIRVFLQAYPDVSGREASRL